MTKMGRLMPTHITFSRVYQNQFSNKINVGTCGSEDGNDPTVGWSDSNTQPVESCLILELQGSRELTELRVTAPGVVHSKRQACKGLTKWINISRFRLYPAAHTLLNSRRSTLKPGSAQHTWHIGTTRFAAVNSAIDYRLLYFYLLRWLSWCCYSQHSPI